MTQTAIARPAVARSFLRGSGERIEVPFSNLLPWKVCMGRRLATSCRLSLMIDEAKQTTIKAGTDPCDLPPLRVPDNQTVGNIQPFTFQFRRARERD